MALCCARGFSHPRLSLFVQVVSCSVRAPQTMGSPTQRPSGTTVVWWALRHSRGGHGTPPALPANSALRTLEPPYRHVPTYPSILGKNRPSIPFQEKNTVLLPTPTIQWSGTQFRIRLFLDRSICQLLLIKTLLMM